MRGLGRLPEPAGVGVLRVDVTIEPDFKLHVPVRRCGGTHQRARPQLLFDQAFGQPAHPGAAHRERLQPGADRVFMHCPAPGPRPAGEQAFERDAEERAVAIAEIGDLRALALHPLEQPGPRNMHARAQPHLGRGDGDQPVGADREEVETLPVEVERHQPMRIGQEEIRLAVDQRRKIGLDPAAIGDQRDPDVREAVFKPVGQEGHGQRVQRGHAQHPPFARRLQGLAHRVEIADRVLRHRQEPPPLRGEFGRHRGPIDERRAEPGLQLLDSAAEGRLRDVPGLGGAREARGFRQRHEIFEPLEFHLLSTPFPTDAGVSDEPSYKMMNKKHYAIRA
ncbi:hypothetical protein SDC9_35814 [bioreactor metagenome]|uniref:Uncharacterized protein n=1 Tax=bioreactor metagenome TaxID=1076179 RepID=A0A644VGH7_9ZZZZ